MAHTVPSTTSDRPDDYFVPEGSNWPWIGTVALAIMMTGGFLWLNDVSVGQYMTYAGIGLIIVMMFGWFGSVIKESKGNLYSLQMDQSFRIAMGWFIFSEVMFFAAFFGAYYFIRTIAIPCWMGDGGGECLSTNMDYATGYEGAWRDAGNGPANLGASADTGKLFAMAAMGDFSHGLKGFLEHSLPLINTLILLTSGLTLTYAHHGIFTQRNGQVIAGLAMTVALGVTFLGLQAFEYYEAYGYGLTLESGGYGSVFYMTTGFHGMHVLIGTIMLAVQLVMAIRRYHTPERHFGFEATAWYWHFVDVVWLGLFIFLYIL